MKKKTSIRLEYCYLIFILIFLFSCQENVQENKDCSKFVNEIYKEVVSDTSLVRGVLDYQKILLERFDESSVKGLNFEAYHLQFYSSMGYGKSVKFENNEFNFWTEKEFKVNTDVLDGYAYFLEGNRPEAEKCNKKTYKLVALGSPRYDKIGALCDYILEYEDQLKFKYEQMNKIK